MKTLIIHPDDRSTDFLKPIYSGLSNTTVLTENISQPALKEAIAEHDQIIMMGHGSPYGLFNVSSIGHSFFTIGKEHVKLLRDKKNIFIWCNADQFVKQHNLPGLFTGMFISEVAEANYCRVIAEQTQVDESNDLFAELMGEQLVKNAGNYEAIYYAINESYGGLAAVNAVAKYNWNRWYINSPSVTSDLAL
jgi:hypothetical protein